MTDVTLLSQVTLGLAIGSAWALIGFFCMDMIEYCLYDKTFAWYYVDSKGHITFRMAAWFISVLLPGITALVSAIYGMLHTPTCASDCVTSGLFNAPATPLFYNVIVSSFALSLTAVSLWVFDFCWCVWAVFNLKRARGISFRKGCP